MAKAARMNATTKIARALSRLMLVKRSASPIGLARLKEGTTSSAEMPKEERWLVSQTMYSGVERSVRSYSPSVDHARASSSQYLHPPTVLRHVEAERVIGILNWIGSPVVFTCSLPSLPLGLKSNDATLPCTFCCTVADPFPIPSNGLTLFTLDATSTSVLPSPATPAGTSKLGAEDAFCPGAGGLPKVPDGLAVRRAETCRFLDDTAKGASPSTAPLSPALLSLLSIPITASASACFLAESGETRDTAGASGGGGDSRDSRAMPVLSSPASTAPASTMPPAESSRLCAAADSRPVPRLASMVSKTDDVALSLLSPARRESVPAVAVLNTSPNASSSSFVNWTEFTASWRAESTRESCSSAAADSTASWAWMSCSSAYDSVPLGERDRGRSARTSAASRLILATDLARISSCAMLLVPFAMRSCRSTRRCVKAEAPVRL
mmetsp:Transcript_17603/g.56919  ORF Transcript_17603/g.56919 Transcript_17603/m.56919 type:complete len:439 (+) Transcript_17603:809-2125(+)